MVFAVSPQYIFDTLGISSRKILIGKKSYDENAWDTIKELEKGNTKRPQRRTRDLLLKLHSDFRKKWFGNSLVPPRAVDLILKPGAKIPRRPWAAAIYDLCYGFEASGSIPPMTFCYEAIRLEQIGDSVRTLASQGNLKAARDQIRLWELAELPSVKSILEDVDRSQTAEEFLNATAPLEVITTLYLYACWWVDDNDVEGHVEEYSFAPKLRGKELVRPAKLWAESLRRYLKISSYRKLADVLHSIESDSEFLETNQDLLRKWMNGSESISWSRAPRFVDSLCKKYGEEHRVYFEFRIYTDLGKIKLMDELFSRSEEMSKGRFPNHKSLDPFNDYPRIVRYAREKKAALSFSI